MIFFSYKGVKQTREGGKFWVDQNIIHDGKVSPKHALGYACFAFCYFCI